MNAMVLMLPVLLLARACGAESGDTRGVEPPPGSARDGGAVDGGVGGSGGDGGPIGPSLSTESARNGGACYDGEDNDDVGGTDCADSSCAADSSACCIGSGSCCGPDGFAAPSEAFDCIGGVAMCTADRFVAFGDPAPTVRDGSFIPNGDSGYDSGAYLAGAGPGGAELFDLSTRRVNVEAVIVPAPDCGATCGEVVGIALTPQALSATTTVRPLVGVLYSGARATVTLIVNGAPVATDALGGTDAPARYRLEVEPTGTVRMVRRAPDGAGGFAETEIGRATFAPIRDAKLVLHGRSRNRLSDPSAVNAGLDELTITREVCDIPTAWVRGADPVPTRTSGTGVWTMENMRSISAWRHDEPDPRIWAAVGVGTTGGDSGIYLLRTADPRVPADLTLLTTAPFGGNGVWDSGGVADPELVYGDGLWHLYYTGIDADGKRRIGEATFEDTAPPRIVAPDAPLIDLGPGERAIEQPAVLPVEGGRWQMIARVTREDGVQTFVRWEQTDGRWVRVPCAEADEAESTTTLLCLRTERRPGAGGEAFDADEIASPELIAHNGSYQLYYAGRSGSRWAVGLLASDDLAFWRDVGEGDSMLAGDTQGFDAFGVHSPAAIGLDGGVGMYYLGSDGARTRIGWAEREATTHRAGSLRAPAP